MADKAKSGAAGQKKTEDAAYIKRRLDMLDNRLDNIDSVVSAVVERVMKQPITLNINCPNCGKDIEISVIGNEKPVK